MCSLDPVLVWSEVCLVKRGDAGAAADNAVDLFELFVGEAHVLSADVVVELPHRSRSDYRAGDTRLLHYPCERELRERAVFFPG